MRAGFDAGQMRSVGECARTRSRKSIRRARFVRERVLFTFASRRRGDVRARFFGSLSINLSLSQREFFFPEEREGALREKFFKVECARFQSKRVDEERKTSLRSKETTEGCSFPAVLSPLSVNSASKKVL
jgi:hypothetical protein